jgi:UDP-N-acetylmuramoylalanine--D-glutamate ligase
MQTASFKGKRVIVLGLGVSGLSAAQFLLKRGAHVVGIDRNTELPKSNPTAAFLCQQGMIFVPERDPIDLSQFDVLVVSPGIEPAHPLYQAAEKYGMEIMGEIELACRELNKTCLGVTGTNGKTTVTLLVTHILQKAGIKAEALGNLGLPLTAAHDETEVFVVELSSFQLETLSARCLDAAVILNITPDHLDRYPSLNDYALAKLNIRKNLKSEGRLFIEDRCLKEFGHLLYHGLHQTSRDCCYSYGYSSSDKIYTDTHRVYRDGIPAFELPSALQGRRSHDVENIMAAYALCHTLGISSRDFLNALASFQKPSHRIEFVKTVSGIHYYDDSKGTNIDAVIRAVEGFRSNIILIAGGVDKGFPYTPWIAAFHNQVSAVCAIGQSKEKIAKDLEGHLPVTLCHDLEEAVQQATRLANPGDNILLSPGCSSFDMFKDYAHRGQEFQRIVNALKENVK